MDEQERKILYFLLVGSATQALFLFLLIRNMIIHHLHSQRLYQAMSGLEVKTLEGERKRLAADIHDEIAPKVAITRMLLSNIRVRPKDRIFAEKVLSNNDEVIDRLREISLALAPTTLLRNGVVAAIDKWCNDLRVTSEIDWRFYNVGYLDGMLNREAEMHMYRMVQEASYNVLKYSKCGRCDIELVLLNKKLEVKIKDNGIGLQQPKQDSTGLNNIALRAEMLKGKMFVNSKPGRCTEILVEIPIKPEICGNLLLL